MGREERTDRRWQPVRVAARAPMARPLARTAIALAGRAAVGASIGAGAAAVALVVDNAIGWTLPFEAERVRDVVTTLVGSSLTIAVFALWMRSIVVSLVAGTFHSRTVVTFLDDAFQRAITGWMVGAISVLVTVAIASPPAQEAGAPPLATALAFTTIVAALLSILVAVRHGAAQLDTSSVVHRLAERGLRVLDETGEVPDHDPPDRSHRPVRSIETDELGWVRHVDRQRLLAALPAGASARLLVEPGSFVAPGQQLLSVDVEVDERRAGALRRTIDVGRTRDAGGDLGYSIDELTDIALYAANTSNDVGTAREALLYLETLLGRLIDRGLPTGHLHGDDGRFLEAAARPTVADHLGRVTSRVAEPAIGDPAPRQLVERMLERLTVRARAAGDDDAEVVLRQVTGWETAPPSSTLRTPTGSDAGA